MSIRLESFYTDSFETRSTVPRVVSVMKRKRDGATTSVGVEEFVNVPRSLVTCVVCADIVHDPRHLDCACQTNFCASCVSRWLETSDRCPACNSVVSEIRTSGRSLSQALDAIKRSCPNDERCRFKRHSYSEVREHATNDCPYRKVACPNDECEEVVAHKNLREHLRLCRLKRCKNFRPPRYGCGAMGTADFIRQHETRCCITADVLRQLEELIGNVNKNQ